MLLTVMTSSGSMRFEISKLQVIVIDKPASKMKNGKYTTLINFFYEKL